MKWIAKYKSFIALAALYLVAIPVVMIAVSKISSIGFSQTADIELSRPLVPDSKSSSVKKQKTKQKAKQKAKSTVKQKKVEQPSFRGGSAELTQDYNDSNNSSGPKINQTNPETDSDDEEEEEYDHGEDDD